MSRFPLFPPLWRQLRICEKITWLRCLRIITTERDGYFGNAQVIFPQFLSLLIGLMLSLQTWSVHGEETNASLAWKVGYAQADITPQPGEAVMLAGFGKPRMVEGTESPLRAQALALEDDAGNRCVLLTADVLGFGRNTVDAVRHKLFKTHQLAPSAVCFAASHTHWGPAVNERTGGAIGDPNVWYLRFLESTLLTLVDQALQDLTAAEVSFGSTEVRIGMCRRLLDKGGQVLWAPDPNGSYDAHTPILHVRRDHSPTQIVLVGHACHPTSMGDMNQWSPDYPGAMRRKLESELEDSRAMFVMGFGADAKVVPQDPEIEQYVFAASPPLSYQAGEKLADAVITRIRTDQPMMPLRSELATSLVKGPLSLHAPSSRLELEQLAFDGKLESYQTWWARKMLAFPDNRTALDYTVQAWRLGDLTCFALEGEVCADWGPLARSLASTSQAMTIGYANEVSCYIPTARIVQEGGYEGDYSHKVYLLPSHFDRQVEVELTALIRRAAAQLSGRPSEDEQPAFDRSRLLVNVDSNSVEQRITTPQQWEPRRRQIIAHIEQVMGPVPGLAYRVPLDVKVIEEVDCGSYIRKKVAYNVDPSDRVESFLLIPKKLQGKTPAILALHGTNSAGKDLVVGLVEKFAHLDAATTRRQYFAQELAERGYIVIAPDYWPYGHYRGQTYNPYQRGYASAAMKGVWSHMRAIDLLETLPEVDANRIGVIGHSLGGYNTLFLGLFEPRVKAMVSSAGYNSFFDYAASSYGGGDLKIWGLDNYLRRIRTVYDNDPEQVPFDFPELLAALAPRPVFTSAPLQDEIFAHSGVPKCLDAARPVYEIFGTASHLEAQFPEGGHDFPDAQRRSAYEFFDRHLSK